MKSVTLYDAQSRPIKTLPTVNQKSLNLDPYFFFGPSYTPTVTTEDIEKRPYQYNHWVHACGWAIARNVSRLPIRIKNTKDNEVLSSDDPIVKELNHLFNRPNPFQTRTTFLQDIILKLILSSTGSNQERDASSAGGQVFILPRDATPEDNGKVDLVKGFIPETLIAYNNDYMSPAIDKAEGGGMGKLDGWMFEVNGKPSTKLQYHNNEIIRIHFVNPYDFLSGISNYTPAQIAVIQDIKADVYNTGLYDNNAMPSGILATDDDLTDEQRRENLKAWYEEMGGAMNAQKIAVLSRGLKYQHIGLTNVDMQWKDMEESSFNKILASFNLNKIALGRYENINHATIKEGRKLLWHDTYIPTAELIAESINSQWIQYINPDWEMFFDTNDVEVLRPDLTNQIESAAKMVDKMGLPPALALRINHVMLSEDDLTKYPWLEEKPTKEVTTENTGDDKEKDDDEEKALDGFIFKELELETDEDKFKFSDDYIKRVLEPQEKPLINKLHRFFNSQRNRMQDKVDAWETSQKSILEYITKEIKVKPEIFLLSMSEENKALEKLLKPVVKNQLLLEKAKLIEELGDLIVWDVTDSTVDASVRARKKEIKEINTTTFKKVHKKIGSAIDEAIATNATPSQAGKLIKDAIGDTAEVRRNNSQTIARTELGIVSSSARYEAFQEEGITYQEWITARDERVRQSHVIQGTSPNNVVAVGKLYKPTNLRHPLDSSGSPGEIINCRCVAIATKKKPKK